MRPDVPVLLEAKVLLPVPVCRLELTGHSDAQRVISALQPELTLVLDYLVRMSPVSVTETSVE